MDFSSINLNLLRALDVLLEERNVTRAGRRLRLSQPAMSAVLRQLRDVLGDPLLVRAGRTMNLTARAREVRGPLRSALRELEQAIRPSAPTELDAELRICASDYVTIVFGPRLFPHLQRLAPRLRLRVVPPAPEQQVEVELADGRYDLTIGAIPPSRAGGLRWRELMRDRYVCLMRRDHPAIARAEEGALRRDDFRRYRQIHVAIRRQDGSLSSDLLGSTDDAFYVGSHVVVPFLIGDSDMIAISAETVADALSSHVDLVRLDPPGGSAVMPVGLCWHESRTTPASEWLMEQIVEIAANVGHA
ncbi:MAG: LysR family transcriptional regulator [Myxococcota bacterium]